MLYRQNDQGSGCPFDLGYVIVLISLTVYSNQGDWKRRHDTVLNKFRKYAFLPDRMVRSQVFFPWAWQRTGAGGARVHNPPVPRDGGLRGARGPAGERHVFSSLRRGVEGLLRHCDGWRHWNRWTQRNRDEKPFFNAIGAFLPMLSAVIKAEF